MSQALTSTLAMASYALLDDQPSSNSVMIGFPDHASAERALAAILANRQAPLEPPEPRYDAASAAELLAALKAARGGEALRLAPGTYSAVLIKGLRFSGPVRIEGERAILTGLDVRDSEGLAFTGLTFAASAGGLPNPFIVMRSKGVRFSQIDVKGPDDAAPLSGVGGLTLRESAEVSVSGSVFHGLQHGLSILDCTGVLVAGNRFHHLQTDGVRGGGVSGLAVTANRFSDFFPAQGDHPDAVQLWTTNTMASAQGIIIADNVIVRGEGAAVQGVFLRDQVKTLPYRDVSIARNLILGGLYNGLMIEGGDGVVIEGNVVAGFPDQKSWVRMERVTNLTMTGNQAQQYLLESKALKEPPVGNEIIASVSDGGAALLAAHNSSGV
ncbi:right-handed parallel beta-helix repeat-containing protein [Phenylobacterium sp.]|uniref:right-handed parallel beta-helix repeat-containing protein n=1 Tax=Phenylobacterium sp. TaxID=1871053 RepID=UPI0035B22E33